MTIALTQVDGASPPQQLGSTALRLTAGLENSVLFHDTGAPRDTFYTRFMVNPSQAHSGAFMIAGGIDDSDHSAWQAVLDVDTDSIILQVGGLDLSASFNRTLEWHTVELGLDAVSGSVSLRLDGVERATLNPPVNATQTAWLGMAFADVSLSGTIDLDQWVLSTSPIGVASAEPVLDHAGDPRRWLVVYNRSDADSVTWAQVYADRRGVPYANLCGLDLSANETVSAAEYELLRQQINTYLDDNHLRPQIVGVLLGLNVPGYTDLLGQGTLTPIAAYLHTDDTHGNTTVNPLYQDAVATRPSADAYTSTRLTGRVDAASLSDAIALLDRADAIGSNALAHDGLADVLIDINPDNANVGPVYTEPVEAWARGGGLASLRLPSVVYDENAPAEVARESLVWGWRDAAPPADYFGAPAGRRAICMQLDPEPQPATSARTPSGTDWLSAGLSAGYAAVSAPSRAYSLSSTPLPHRFFEALRKGWTIAEAWAVSQPFLRDGLQIVGDPLMTVAFPKSGYEVYGPAPRVDQIDLSQPIATLHAGQRSYTLASEEAPVQGQASRYLLQHTDDEGRADLATVSTYALIEQGEVLRPALPAWPVHEGWRVSTTSEHLSLHAAWPLSLRSLGIDLVELQSQVGSEEPLSVQEVVANTGQQAVTFVIERPEQTMRFRFRTHQGPASFDSPWSQWVVLPTSASTPINIFEDPS